MKTLAYVMYVIAFVAFCLTALCVINGNESAVVPLLMDFVAFCLLFKVVDSYEGG